MRPDVMHARCHLCGQVVDAIAAHSAHEDGCTSNGVCRCDLFVCPGCCPECAAVVA